MTLEVVKTQISRLTAQFKMKKTALSVPATIDSDSLELFCDLLNEQENALTLAMQLSTLFPLNLDIFELLNGAPILVAQETHRQYVGQLVGSAVCEYELVVTRDPLGMSESDECLPRSLYVRKIDDIVEVGLAERNTRI
jgi:hypothetical protein